MKVYLLIELTDDDHKWCNPILLETFSSAVNAKVYAEKWYAARQITLTWQETGDGYEWDARERNISVYKMFIDEKVE